MVAIALRADLKLATATLEAIDAACVRQAEDGLRAHLGASLIGRECERQLWYSFRWAKLVQHAPRILRLFERGQREENILVGLLRMAGAQVVTVDPNTGKQYTFSSCGGHFGGSMDGAAMALPDAPKTWHVLEFKTHGKKSFDELVKVGVHKAKPEHYAQMQCYMAWTGMDRALYMAVCKDDDRLHLERIDFDRDMAEALMIKAARIIDTPEPPARLSEDPAYFACKFCDYSDLCHGTAAPLPTCRTCVHATPEKTGDWTCARHQGKTLTVPEQKVGCQAHRVIPILLANFADALDASDTDNWVRYRLKDGGGEFVNGARPEGLDSAEIHAAGSKTMLADGTVQQLREQLDAKVVA